VLLACGALLAVGLTALHSVSLAANVNWVGKQLVAVITAAAAMAMVFCCSLSSLRRQAKLLMILVLTLLAAVFLFEPRNGAHRWLGGGGLSLQPAELCKWTLLLLTASYASRPQFKRHAIKFVFPILGWAIPTLGLIILQPDFGTLVLLSLVVLSVLFLSGFDLRAVMALFAIFLIILIVLLLTEPYRMQRLVSFVDPFNAAGGYNQKHAIIAFVQGGLWGRGIGRSIEKWGYLPESHNDFIISIIAEETGLLGLLIVCALIALLVMKAINIARRAEERGEIFGALYAFGFAVLVTTQSAINICGNLALLPSKGFTLPLVSYGGSSLLSMGLLVGVLLRIDFENRREQRGGGT
jgi:cell division protein FtsW